MRTFVIGDIHGAHKAMVQCFERSPFNPHKDRLIALGDVCDGWPDVRQSIDELIKVRDLLYIIGNHDLWALDWARTGKTPKGWLEQGGANTVASYGGKPMPEGHVQFLSSARPYVESDQRLFVHGGFDPDKPVAEQTIDIFVWSRDLLYEACQKHFFSPDYRYSSYEEIFVGHTPTQNFYSSKPMKFCNMWDIDTGAGWSGKLTIMDVDTKEYWQSDPTPELYPGLRPRK